jgi:gamma-glutamylcyclotransferase (GGCT)/AIG2-like uncharacterized protein YtfP
MTTDWATKTWAQRLADFLAAPNEVERFNWPFPVAVFGTLRNGCGNNPRMHGGRVADHRRAFLPHYSAKGLMVSFDENASAPFEVFYYEPDEWNKMIPGVDRLESFYPAANFDNTNGSYYYRTLMGLRLLPADFSHRLFPSDRPNLGEYRSLGIDPATWDTFEMVPAWVYSRIDDNNRADATVGAASPVLWWPGRGR